LLFHDVRRFGFGRDIDERRSHGRDKPAKMITNVSEDLIPDGQDRIGWNRVALMPGQQLRRFKHCLGSNLLQFRTASVVSLD
jgi:hypothetical protein